MRCSVSRPWTPRWRMPGALEHGARPSSRHLPCDDADPRPQASSSTSTTRCEDLHHDIRSSARCREPSHAAPRAGRARWALRTSPLLLSGEAGTGKATLALAIHANGPRRAFPYPALDCRTLGHTAAGEPAHVSRWEATLQAELAQLDGNEQAAVDQLTPAAMAGPREPRPAGHLWRPRRKAPEVGR